MSGRKKKEQARTPKRAAPKEMIPCLGDGCDREVPKGGNRLCPHCRKKSDGTLWNAWGGETPFEAGF